MHMAMFHWPSPSKEENIHFLCFLSKKKFDKVLHVPSFSISLADGLYPQTVGQSKSFLPHVAILKHFVTATRKVNETTKTLGSRIG